MTDDRRLTDEIVAEMRRHRREQKRALQTIGAVIVLIALAWWDGLFGEGWRLVWLLPLLLVVSVIWVVARRRVEQELGPRSYSGDDR